MGQVNAEASSSRLPHPPKVSQVDADELDEGLAQMLGERVEKAVGNFKVNPSVPLFFVAVGLLVGRLD